MLKFILILMFVVNIPAFNSVYAFSDEDEIEEFDLEDEEEDDLEDEEEPEEEQEETDSN